MTFEVRLAPNARRDRDRILAWFDEHHPEHSERFLDDFYDTARRIGEMALVPAVSRFGLRHVRTRVFKYQLWYRVFEDAVVLYVVAVLHERQDPEELAQRVL